MAYGLQILNPDGTVKFDSSSYGWQLIDQFMVGAGSSGSANYSQWAGWELRAVAVPADYTAGHWVSMDNSTMTLTWTNRYVADAIPEQCNTTIFLFGR